jgi:hypothetical protein
LGPGSGGQNRPGQIRAGYLGEDSHMTPEVNWEDPRIAPHLQHLADESFIELQRLARDAKIPILPGMDQKAFMPFDQMDSRLCNQWKALIIQFLEALMPEGVKPEETKT